MSDRKFMLIFTFNIFSMKKVQFMVLWAVEPEPNSFELELVVQFEVLKNR